MTIGSGGWVSGVVKGRLQSGAVHILRNTIWGSRQTPTPITAVRLHVYVGLVKSIEQKM